MATPITRFPAGLLDLIGTKTTGRNPDRMASDAGLQLEASWMFGQSRYEVLAEPIAPAGAGLFTAITVPDGELWIAWRVCSTYATAVAESVTWKTAIFARSLTFPTVVVDSGTTTAIVGVQQNSSQMTTNFPVWLPAGFKIGIIVVTLPVGPPSCTVTAWVSKLKV